MSHKRIIWFMRPIYERVFVTQLLLEYLCIHSLTTSSGRGIKLVTFCPKSLARALRASLPCFAFFCGLQQSLPHFIRVVAGYSGRLTGTLRDKRLRLLVFRQPCKALSSLSWCKAFKHPAVQDLNCVWSCQATHVGIRTKDSALHSMNNANFHLFRCFWNFCLLLNIPCTGMAGFTWMWRTQSCWSTFPDLVPIFFRLSHVLLRSQGACMSSSV